MKNELKALRLSKSMTQPDVSRALRKVEPRADTGMVCRYENGVCLPTAAQIEVLERVLGADRLEIWDRADLDLTDIHAPEADPQTGKREETRYRKCYRIPREYASQIPEDILRVTGYASWNDWHAACLRRLVGEYGARIKARKRKEQHDDNI